MVGLLVLWLVAGSEFSKYPADPVLVGVPAEPKLTTPRERNYRGVLRKEARKGPNFNGHFRVVQWGCGTNCIQWATIDLVTGTVWIAPDGAFSCAGSNPPGDDRAPDWLEFHLTSALLYLYTCLVPSTCDRTFDTRGVYLWKAGEPKLLRKEHILRRAPKT